MAMWIDLLEKYMIGNTEYSILAHADWLIFFTWCFLVVTQYGPSRVGIAAKYSCYYYCKWERHVYIDSGTPVQFTRLLRNEGV